MEIKIDLLELMAVVGLVIAIESLRRFIFIKYQEYKASKLPKREPPIAGSTWRNVNWPASYIVTVIGVSANNKIKVFEKALDVYNVSRIKTMSLRKFYRKYNVA